MNFESATQVYDILMKDEEEWGWEEEECKRGEDSPWLGSIFADGIWKISISPNPVHVQESKCDEHCYSESSWEAKCQERSVQPRKREESWDCDGCGNRNYSWRMVCNMRNCRKIKPAHLRKDKVPAKSWVCWACGNLNYDKKSGAAYCNMRRCRSPRYGAAC